MRFKNKKSLLLEFPFYFIMAIILLWPFFVKAQSVTLNTPATACLGSSGQMNLSWNSDIINPSYYILRKPAGESTFTEVAGPISNTFFADNNIVSDKSYFYKIRAESGTNIYFSNEVQVSALYCRAVLLSPTPSCQTDGPRISLNWSNVSGNLSRYEIYRDGVQISQTSNTNFNDGPNLEGTKTYNYFIRAVWQDGYATSSDVAPATALACPPVLTVISDCATEAPGGPRNNLSWNSLLGVQNYQIYRKAQSETVFSLLTTLTGTSYTDYLVQSLTGTYSQGGQVSYYVKAIWLTDQKDSSIQSADILRCPPYLKAESVCNSSELLNPEMRLSWTKTQSATLYNIYRNGSFYIQIINPGINDFIDYLDPATDCLNKICTHSYKVEAIVTSFPAFFSNQATKDIDCATPIAPSPAPVLNAPSAYCVSGDSRISLSWTSSDNIVYYTLYRNEVGIINLLETSFTDSGIESGYSYTYRVTAFGKGGTFTDSLNSQTITSVSCVQPSQSTLSLSPGCEIGKPYVNLSWIETTNTESYEIWRGPSSSNLSLLITFNKASPEFTSRTWKDTNVSLSTDYYYKIVSKGPPGVPGSQSNVPGITTYSCLPTTPSVTVLPACSGNNPVNNLSWVTDGVNTTRYEIFRQDYLGGTSPIMTIFNVNTKNWIDTSVSPLTSYTYKVEAIGYTDIQRSTQGWKPAITTYNCSAPGSFTLSEPNTYCQGPYIKSELSWSNSANAFSYDLLRNRYSNGSIAQTDTLSNVASLFTDRGFANALSFDGADDYVNAGSAAILDNMSSITITAWIYPRSYGENNLGRIYDKFSNGSYAGPGFSLCSGTTNCGGGLTNSFQFFKGFSSGNGIWTAPSNSIVLNSRNHVAVTFVVNSANDPIFYLNGNLVATAEVATPNGNSDDDSAKSAIVGNNDQTTGTFDGLIDEVRVYNRALNASEINQLYQGIYSNDNGMVGLWHFDEGSGSSASDSSNFGNNGILINGPAWIQNGPQSQTKYSWQAKANGPGGSTYSNTTSSNTMPLCQPTKPGLVLNSFCNTGNNLPNVTLKWSYTTATVKYEIYRERILIKTINQGDSEFSSRTWIDTNDGDGLDQNASYTYQVKAIGPTGLTNQSDDNISITTPNCAGPSQPQNLTAVFACGSTGNSYPRVNLSWSTSTNATSYTIYRSPSSSPFPVSTALTSYTDTAVSVNATYNYYVIAYGPGGASLPSDIAATTTGYCSPSISTITALTTGCESNSSVNYISWSDATTFNTFEYKIYRNTSATPPPTPLITFASTTPEFSSRTWKDNSGLNPSTIYYYWIKTSGPAGESSYSSSKSIATYSCGITPSTPTLNLDNLFCQDNVPYAVLSWNTVANAYSYNLYRTNPDASQSVYPTRLSSLADKGSAVLNFDGIDDYVNIPSSASLNPTSITMEAWIYPTSLTSASIINKANQYILFLFNGKVTPHVYIGGSFKMCSYSSALPLNQWSHVIATYDGVDIKIYINGTQVNSCNNPYGDITSNTNPLKIQGMPGLLDDVRIYGRALSSSEVTDHYNGLYKNESDLRGAWHFDEGSGQAVSDSSSFGNNGTLGPTLNSEITDPTWQTNSPSVLKVLPLENSKTYKYRIKAFGADTESVFSNEISFTASSCLPAKPDLTVTVQCQEERIQLFLDWSEDSNTSYWSIYKKRAEEPYSFLANISSPQTDFTDDNVESGIVYEYYLTAMGKGGNTASDAISQTVSFCYPQPSKPVISATSTCYGYSSRSKIEWQPDPTGNTISYNIWRRNMTLGETEFPEDPLYSGLSASSTQFLDPVIEANNYIYEVEAVGSGTGNSTSSDPSQEITSYECSKIPPFPPTLCPTEPAPLPPACSNYSFTYSVDGLRAVSLRWSDVGNADNYKVFRRLASESQFAKNQQPWWKNIFNKILGNTSLAAYEYPLVTLASSTLNYVDYTVTDGVIYEYQVMASNVNGNTLSNIIQVVVPIARPGEFDLSALRLPDYRVYLTWTEAETSVAGGQVTYDILRSNASDFSSPITICSGVIDPRECYDNNPPLLSTVYYKAIATNIGGITESDIEKVGLPAPIWKEIMPW